MLKRKEPKPLSKVTLQPMRPRRPKGDFGTGSGTPGQIKKKPYEDKIMKIAKDKRREEINKKAKDLFKKIKDQKPTGRVNMDDVKRASKMNKGGYAKGKK